MEQAAVKRLLGAGLALGLVGDALLRAPGPMGLNMSLWVLAIGLAAYLLQRRTSPDLDRERLAWLAGAVVFAAGLAWRDSPALKMMALGCVTLAFALAAYQASAAWVRHAGVLRYLGAWAIGALHAWTAAASALRDANRSRGADAGRSVRRRHAMAVARGLAIAAPLIGVFGALFMSADAVFDEMVRNLVHFDFELIAQHLLVFSVSAWLATGYLRGFLQGTESAALRVVSDGALLGVVPKRPALRITEIATALAAIDVLFLLFVLVQFRYLFGGDALVQVTPDLTYAEYARRGFFELVSAVALVVPVLLAADWLLERERQRDDVWFRVLAGVQIALVFAITASALQRLRLYHASYGLTEARFYAMVLLIWIGAMLLWFAATVLRGRRNSFAFGALAAGLATVALLFVINPDRIIARTNVADPARFDVAYASSLSGDAVPVLIDALPALPPDVQCQLAQHLLHRWPPDARRSFRTWSWSAARASAMVREHAARLREIYCIARAR